jgi:hypothetical protein
VIGIFLTVSPWRPSDCGCCNVIPATSLRRGADQRHVRQATEAGHERLGEKRLAKTATIEVLQLDLVIARKECYIGRISDGLR